MKKTYKLVHEFSSNLQCLVLNYEGIDQEYITLFSEIFLDCTFVKKNDCQVIDTDKSVDIVFLKIDDSFNIDELKNTKNLLKIIGKKNDLLEVYLLEENLTNLKISQMAHQLYFVTGTVPSPFNKKNVYKFLNRVLKRIIDIKNLYEYVSILEEQLANASVSQKTQKTEDVQVEKIKLESPNNTIKKVDKKREQDIRYSHVEKISALEFVASLDDVIVDKIENFQEELDTIISDLYDMESANPHESLILLQSINKKVDAVYKLIDSLIVFPIIARAFETLHLFIENLGESEVAQEEKKKMFITMNLGMINDLEKWLDVVFHSHATQDIHYLDASFSSNMLEIEKVFIESEEEDTDEDDLEFF